MRNDVWPGFQAVQAKCVQTNERNDQLDNKIEKSGVEAARRKFTPEFMNRLDKVVVFVIAAARAGHRTAIKAHRSIAPQAKE